MQNCSIRRWIKDPFPALSHWLGAALSVAALVVLLVQAAPRPWHIVGFAIYGASLIALYCASALAHTAHCTPAMAHRLNRLDYAAIFLLIAGTYTPLCLVTLGGPWGWSLLSVEWLLAAIGIVGIARRKGLSTRWRVLLYLCMGWLAVVATGPVLASLPSAALAWLLAGGAAYTLGALVFVLDWPHLWPSRFVAHDLWHVMVLLGSGCHYIVMTAFVA
jgi:hemolysin III